MPNNIPVPTESVEQQIFFEYVDFLIGRFPELEAIYHIPNEGKRSKSTGARMKKEGLVKGVPDIHLPIPKGKYHSLYIELKRTHGAKVSKDQRDRIAILNKYGNYAVVSYGWEEAAKVLKWYLLGCSGSPDKISI